MSTDDSPSFRFLPLTVSVETEGGVANPLALRGTPLPAVRTQVFSTASDNQESVTIQFCMGERRFVKDNLALATFELKNIPPKPKGEPRIEVTIEIDGGCRVKVSASEKVSGSTIVTETVQPQVELSQGKIQQLLDDAERHRDADRDAMRDVELRNKVQELMTRAEARLRSNPDEQTAKSLADLGLAVEADDSERIQEAYSTLERSFTYSFDDVSNVFSGMFSMGRRSASKPAQKATARRQPSTEPSEAGKAGSGGRSEAITSTPKPSVVLGRIFGGGAFTLDPALCFVLMPFDEHLQPVYDTHIKEVVEGESLACTRADDIVGTRHITWDIWEQVSRARLVIADLTGQNPNVFYELGLAHAISKQVILITQSMDFVPFDLKAIRCIAYEYTAPGMKSFEQQLRRTIREIMNT